MCGIIGQINRNKPLDPENFFQMRDSLTHRGPDGYGHFFNESLKVGLAHRRLSIIDLTDNGKQPMSNEDKTIHITFNGEIYNFKELKEELKEKHQFKSNTDTEVLIHGYEEWGLEILLKRINGMFAFAIYDSKQKQLILARDRIGIKPLYFYFDNETIIFASELKAIQKSNTFNKEIDFDGVADYLMYRYIPHPRTIFKNTHKLSPGCYINFSLNSWSLTQNTYWELNHNPNNLLDEETVIGEIKSLLNKSVERRLLADVDVETFLSGGIDSTTITALAKEKKNDVRAFTIEVKDIIKNELLDAQKAAEYLNVPINYDVLDSKLFDKIHRKVIAQYDEPHGDTSNISTYLLCQNSSESAKVALSGDGGDELFYGYNWHVKFSEESTEAENPLELYRNTICNTLNFEQAQALLGKERLEQRKSSWLFEDKMKEKGINKTNIHYLDTLTFLVDDILTKVDIASMAHSLEVRVPFLDHELVEYMFTIPHKLLFKNSVKKYLLKQAFKDILPDRVIDKKKQGFSTPSVNWLKINYKHELLRGRLVRDGVFDKKSLKKLIESKLHEEHKWLLYVLEIWYRNNFPLSTQKEKILFAIHNKALF